jgi:hypothetical protein
MSNMFLNIVSTFKGDGIKKATGELGAFSGKMGGFGSVLGKVGGALAAFGATAKAISFGQEAITQARDLERNMYGLQKVFGLMSPVMTEFVEGASSIGLSQSEAAKASTFLGSVLKQSGFEMSDVAVETEKLVKLGVDLATLYGYDVQEALLGMTALFRGEYDPIEKFGVAMKQSEINAELAARGQDNLAGAARRNAEQTIRLELLYQRAADALGSFDEQTNNLFVSQKVLGATFRDMQAAVGTALIPAITTLNQELTNLVTNSTPTLISMFERLAEVLTEVVSLFSDALNPATALGDSIFALGVRFESLLQTIFGKDFNIGIIFDIASEASRIFLTLLHDVILMIQNIITFFQLLGEQIGAFFNALATGNWEDYFNTDWAARFKGAMDDNANAIYNASGAMDTYSGKLRKSAIEAKLLAGELLTVAEAMFIASPDAGTSKARRAQLNLENKRRASGIGASVAAATGGDGGAAAEKAAREAEKIAKELADAQEKAARELQDALDEAARKEEERIRKREDAYKSFADSVKSIFGGIKESILSSFSLPDLGNSVNSITRNIKKLLERTKAFAANINSLSQQGLTNDLLQQVIAAGPMAGGRLAQALAGAGGGFIGDLNQAYGQFGSIASDIAGVGARSAFANGEVINNYYQIEVSGGVGSGPTIGKAIVDAIKSYERTSGAVWQGA